MTFDLSTIRRWSMLAAALLLVSAVLAACGGGDGGDNGGSSGSSGGGASEQTTTQGSSGSGAGATTALAETADESGGLSFSRRALTAKSGSVTITLDNPSGNALPHAIELEGNGVEEVSDTIQPGQRASVTVDLRPGTYTFYCPVDGHREQGMKGTLTVH